VAGRVLTVDVFRGAHAGILSYHAPMSRTSIPLLLFLIFLALGGCTTDFRSGRQLVMRFDPRYLAKTEIDRVIDTNRAEVMAGLRRLTRKLYQRNPWEWKKGGRLGVDTAVDRLFAGRLDFPELGGRREGDAALFAFSDQYQGDRILAVMAGLIGMVDAAFEHNADFYMLDNLDEQKLYNCARNIEIAVWKMSSTRSADGGPLLVSNELDPNNPNLSFEREFGRIIGLLDFLAKVVADKHGRSITRLTQSIATAVFLPVGSL